MALGFGTSLEQSMLGSDLSSALGSPAPDSRIIVPVPIQVQPKAKAKKSTAPVQAQVAQAAPQMQIPNFGPTPTFQQDTVSAVPAQPVWHEELGRYLKGQSLDQALSPPQYQGFGMPVFSDAQAFAMTPEGYNNVLDTTKNNIAFNNKVAGDNYNNTLNIIKTLQAADSANQEQYSRSIQNRNAVLSGNKTQQDIAYDQSPQQKANMQLQLSNATTQYHAQLQERLESKMAQVHHQYRLSEISAQTAGAKSNALNQFRLDAMKTVTDVMKDTYLSAVKGMQPDDLDRYQKALASGDNQMLNSLLQNMQVKDPVSAANLRAGIYAEQYLQSASGLPMGSILANMQLKPEKEKGIPVIKSKEELRKYLGK